MFIVHSLYRRRRLALTIGYVCRFKFDRGFYMEYATTEVSYPAADLAMGVSKTTLDLAAQLKDVWTEVRDNFDDLSVEDPANPTGNDLSGLLNSAKAELESTARRTLNQIDTTGWETVFGAVDANQEAEKTESLRRAAAAVVTPTRPWLPEE